MRISESLESRATRTCYTIVIFSALLAFVGVSQGFEMLSSGDSRSRVHDPGMTERGIASSTGGFPEFVKLVKQLKPQVVQVSAIAEGPITGPGEDSSSVDGSQELFGVPVPPDYVHSVGSGVIIDRNGLILTNNGLIESAQKVSVMLSHGEVRDAKIVGRDAALDVALIKIDGSVPLSAVHFGNSDQVEVGEWVIAMGNPFGLGISVTTGIVSGKGAIMGTGTDDSFIQTDASVNPGSSGGPLLNLRGEIVGIIKTSIVSTSGQDSGISIAVPINKIKESLPQLARNGQIARG